MKKMTTDQLILLHNWWERLFASHNIYPIFRALDDKESQENSIVCLQTARECISLDVLLVSPLTVERMSLVPESLHIPKPSDDDRHLSDSGVSCKLSYARVEAVPTINYTCWTLRVTVSCLSE